MAVIDAKLLFGDDTALPATATTEYSDVLDLGIGKDEFSYMNAGTKNADYGEGEPLFVYFKMTETAVGATMTLTVAVQDSADNSTFAAAEQGGILSAVAVGTLVAGYMVRIKLPDSLSRYVRLAVTTGTAGASAGTYTAYVGPAE